MTTTLVKAHGAPRATAEISTENGITKRRNSIRVAGRAVYTTLAVEVSGGAAYAMAVKSVLEAEIQEYFRKASTFEATA